MDSKELKIQEELYQRMSYAIRSIEDVYDHDLVVKSDVLFKDSIERTKKLPTKNEKQIAQWTTSWLKIMSILKATKKK